VTVWPAAGCRTASRTISARDRAPGLARMCDTCVCTVLRDKNNAAATSGFDRPSATRYATFTSVGVSGRWRQGDALLGVLGLGGSGAAVDRLVLFSATLAMLRQAAADHPLLIVVDDAQWLDRASALALGFVGRRLSGTRVGMLAGLRLDAEGFFDAGGLTELVVRPLDEASAAALVQACFPALAVRVRQRVLAEAEGHPLALLELYLVEAAVRTGRRQEASAHVAAMKEAKIEALSPRLA
jgi:hypothetical protein